MVGSKCEKKSKVSRAQPLLDNGDKIKAKQAHKKKIFECGY